MKTGALLFIVLCLVAAIRPLIGAASDSVLVGEASGFPGWAAAPIPPGLRSVPLREEEARFVAQFPGRVAVFADDRVRWIVRWVSRPTRKLHPVADCLRATGYDVAPRPIFASPDGSHWGVNSARRGGEFLVARERIVDAHGKEFTDISAWFWHAVLDRTEGPWWSVTKIEPETDRRKS